MTDEREFFEGLVYHSAQGKRFTQQSPVMPDVWIHYGMHPGEQLDLLLEPSWHYTPADLARQLAERLKLDRNRAELLKYRTGESSGPQIACNQNVVAVKLWFDQVVRAALPLSNWWKSAVAKLDHGEHDALARILLNKSIEKKLALALKQGESDVVDPDVIWFARVAGLVAHLGTARTRRALARHKLSQLKVKFLTEIVEDHKLIASSFVGLLRNIAEVVQSDDAPLFSVNRNRSTSESIYASVNAIKADAARVVFTTRGKNIAWAVVDSGIDATHMAFRKYRREGAEDVPFESPFPAERSIRSRVSPNRAAGFANNTRVVASYDFVHIRELLGAEPDDVKSLDRTKFPILKDPERRAELVALLQARGSHVIDWERLEPFVRIPHEDGKYRVPENRHGTHVAGIIAADWRVQEDSDANPPQGIDMAGVAPEVELYDFRVLDAKGQGSEFAIMSALQLIRDLNNRRNFVAIHGVNLSFSIQHDVANYACGRTPVCEEAERLVSSGIVVIAAAGNSGRARYVTPSGLDDEGFRTVSITDPGNAASVITVGATHRSDAHTYGVSYFSSRGPTGDGRLKPDLVAPGEKIRSTIPNNGEALLDGTSMAAPHASGAAALLLSRHPEFIGQPQKIKEILCKTATDLGRERYFQGAGLVDILRALQSV